MTNDKSYKHKKTNQQTEKWTNDRQFTEMEMRMT